MRQRKGFTLLELMIVVVILGVLALIAVPALLNAVEQSRESAVLGNVSAASSTMSSRLAVDTAVVVGDVIADLNASATNPFNDAGIAYVAGACVNAGEVGILDNGDGSFTIDGCDGDAAKLTTKTIYAPEDI